MHAAIWDLRKELPTPHLEGRLFEVPVWRLGGKVVCRNAFVVVTGAVPTLLPILPHLRDSDVLQIGAVSEGVSFACVSRDVILVKGEVRFGTSQ